MAPSITDVAEAAGLSKATISRVISGSAAVSQEVRERALRAIAALNYQPNRSAQTLRRRRNPAFPGLVYNTLVVAALNADKSPDSFQRNSGAAYDGIMEAAHERGIDLMLKLIPADQCNLPIAPPCLSGLACDAILASPHPNVSGTAVQRAGRVVWFGAMGRGVENAAVVEPDSWLGVGAMLRYLRELGHRRICGLGSNTTHAPFVERMRAFRTLAREMGLEPCEPVEFTDGEAAMPEFVERFRRSSCRPTAILTTNDGIGSQLVTALVQAGFHVPGEVSVTGFDGRDKSRWCTPGLTTWAVDWRELGRAAVHQAVLMAEREHTDRVLIGGKLLEQGSTARAPGA